ncbi:hypothetical protein BC936DRAFT_140965 [Jimgerdemannia flammicorona]|uniref:Uncharacterized protein n=1 Tax=Jimgerdemannia flammicorona TaxID=994334 RepID=A0A433A340_9FUNG|nr:hypothetical protein BC936DRAFT_140965 [Jimgerdemannia flammicorona]
MPIQHWSTWPRHLRILPLLFLLLLLLFRAPTPSAAHGLVSDSYRTSKHVMISSQMGGISHIKAGFDIGVILRERGYQVTYVTNDGQLNLARPWGLPTVSIGPLVMDKEKIRKLMFDEGRNFDVRQLSTMMRDMNVAYERLYLGYRKIFDEIKPDVVMCESMLEVCFDAAHMAGIPFVILTSVIMSPDGSAPYTNNVLSIEPTTKNQNLLQRLYSQIIMPTQALYYFYPSIAELNKQRVKMGVPPVWGVLTGRWENSVKLVNTFFGFEVPRPIGPLVHLIGPVMGDAYPSLTPPLSTFLTKHSRVIYVAFGQNVPPSSRTLGVLLTALATSVYTGVVDGVIWAIVQTRSADFPLTITVVSGNVNGTIELKTADLLANGHPAFHFTSWAPQQAILNHTSTRLFISHGGVESTHEALYTGTPLLVQPYFGDQPMNAVKLHRAGVALQIDRDTATVTEVTEKIRRLVEDPEGFFAGNMSRMQALAQIGSRRVERGADIVEEVMYGGTGLMHLQSPDKSMTWWKAGNYDLYAVLMIALVGTVFRIGSALVQVARMLMGIVNQPMKKVKQI